MLAALLALLPFTVSAQVFKCESPTGQVQYSDQPCGPGRYLGSGELRANSLDNSAVRKEVEMDRRRAAAEQRFSRERERQEAAASARVARAAGCPTDRELRNLETSASSITYNRKARIDFDYAKRMARHCAYNGGDALKADQAVRAEIAQEDLVDALNRPKVCSFVGGGQAICN